MVDFALTNSCPRLPTQRSQDNVWHVNAGKASPNCREPSRRLRMAMRFQQTFGSDERNALLVDSDPNRPDLLIEQLFAATG